MTTDLKFHTDAGLVAATATGITREADDGSDTAQQLTFYLGSALPSLKWRATSNPGTDQITLSIEYVNPTWISGTQTLGDIVRAGLYNYEATNIAGGGATAGSAPTWPATPGDTVVDNEVTWTNIGLVHLPSEVKLSVDEAGLATAVAGDPLNLGLELLSGTANRQDIWVEVDDPSNTVALATDLKLELNEVQQEAV